MSPIFNLRVHVNPGTYPTEFAEKAPEGHTISRWIFDAPTGPIRYAEIKRLPNAISPESGALVIMVETVDGAKCLVSCPTIARKLANDLFAYDPDLFTVAVMRPNLARALVLCHGSGFPAEIRDTMCESVEPFKPFYGGFVEINGPVSDFEGEES